MEQEKKEGLIRPINENPGTRAERHASWLIVDRRLGMRRGRKKKPDLIVARGADGQGMSERFTRLQLIRRF